MSIVGIIFTGLFLLIVAWQILTYARAKQTQGQPLPIINNEFDATLDAVRNHGLIIFHSPNCGPCKAMLPHVNKLAKQQPNILVIDVTQQPKIARQFRIRATPTTIQIRNGHHHKVILGALSASKLQSLLQNRA